MSSDGFHHGQYIKFNTKTSVLIPSLQGHPVGDVLETLQSHPDLHVTFGFLTFGIIKEEMKVTKMTLKERTSPAVMFKRYEEAQNALVRLESNTTMPSNVKDKFRKKLNAQMEDCMKALDEYEEDDNSDNE